MSLEFGGYLYLRGIYCIWKIYSEKLKSAFQRKEKITGARGTWEVPIMFLFLHLSHDYMSICCVITHSL